jgi:hypothetical protein
MTRWSCGLSCSSTGLGVNSVQNSSETGGHLTPEMRLHNCSPAACLHLALCRWHTKVFGHEPAGRSVRNAPSVKACLGSTLLQSPGGIATAPGAHAGLRPGGEPVSHAPEPGAQQGTALRGHLGPARGGQPAWP